MKKLLSLFLSLTIILTFATPVVAATKKTPVVTSVAGANKTVKTGTTIIKATKLSDGYNRGIKFKAPKAGTYRFTFKDVTCSENGGDVGFVLSFNNANRDDISFKLNGEKLQEINFGSEEFNTNSYLSIMDGVDPSEDYYMTFDEWLDSGNTFVYTDFKVDFKLKKGQIIYIMNQSARASDFSKTNSYKYKLNIKKVK